MNLDDCYRALGIKPGASLQEARRSYHQRVKFFHPDRHQASPGLLRKATEETKKLNLAYERICRLFGGGRSAQPSPEKKKRNKSAQGEAPSDGQSFVIPCCGMKMKWVAAGRFQMGSPAAEAGRSNDEGPQTEVTISRGYWLGMFTVTQEEWRAVAEDGSGLNPKPSYFCGERLPVEQVSWNDCEQWLQELNTLEGTRLPRGFSIVCRRKRNGNSPAVPEPQLGFFVETVMSNSMHTLGIPGTAAVKLMWSARKRRMRGARTTCMAMFGNGAAIGTVRCRAEA